MAGAAFVALLAAVATPVLAWRLGDDGASFAFAAVLRAMPLGWWLQIVALAVLALLCLAVLVRSDADARGTGFVRMGRAPAPAARRSPGSVSAATPRRR